jgi:hypothetical protein
MLARALILAGACAAAAAQCGVFTSCFSCAGDARCAWCQTPSSSDSPAGVCQPYSSSCGAGLGKYASALSCPSTATCSRDYTALGCSACASAVECEWWSPGAAGSAGAVCARYLSTQAPAGWYAYLTAGACAVDPAAVISSLSTAIIAVIVISVLVVCVLPVALFIAICVCGCAICGMGRPPRTTYVAVAQQQAVYQAFPQQQQQQPPQQQQQQQQQYPHPQQAIYLPQLQPLHYPQPQQYNQPQYGADPQNPAKSAGYY